MTEVGLDKLEQPHRLSPSRGSSSRNYRGGESRTYWLPQTPKPTGCRSHRSSTASREQPLETEPRAISRSN